MIYECFVEGWCVVVLFFIDVVGFDEILFFELIFECLFCVEGFVLFEVFELEIVCYYNWFLWCNFDFDIGLYLFGFCTMKYNLWFNE